MHSPWNDCVEWGFPVNGGIWVENLKERFLLVQRQVYDVIKCKGGILNIEMGSCIYCVHKIFRNTNISYPLIRTLSCAYQGVRNASLSENFVNAINEWSLTNKILSQAN